MGDGRPSPTDGSATPPKAYKPCATGKCWDAPKLSGACGRTTVNEDYSTGKYNVHEYPLSPPRGVTVELTLERTAGSWHPALILHDASGVTLYDGRRARSTSSLAITSLASGRTGTSARVRIVAKKSVKLSVFVSGWRVIDSGFSRAMDTNAKYSLAVVAKCKSPTGVISPPNFDASNVAKGYYLLPQSQPSGLYTRKADDCSRGTKLLIDVLYTVARRFNQIRPSLTPISILDLNEGSCSTVNHQTHDDGTHADLVAGCATNVSCTDNQPAIDLAKAFVDTGKVCGILNNNTAVQKVVNTYFASKYSYTPWRGTFMRSVSGHTHHFHIRVKKPDGTCN